MLRKRQWPDFGLYKLERADLKRAEEMLADTLSDDPGVLFILNSEVCEKNMAKPLHRFNLEYGMRYGIVYATSEKLEGIAILLPPEETRKSAIKSIKSGGLFIFRKKYKNALKALRTYEKISINLHKKYAPFPHWYLLALAVDKEHQGKHMASLLLKPFFDYFDKYDYPCYLETHKRKNVEIYEHYGFHAKEICLLPNTAKRHWAMIRMPRGK
ncbi:MAG: GNAT family N-acetyltransferase [Clostridia bacterium]|jgi:GNAT superfamily N-acetyltransferase